MNVLMDALNSTGAITQPLILGLVAPTEALWDYVPVGIYICDRDGRILGFNRKAVDLWGREPATGESAERFCGCYRVYSLDGDFIAPADCPMAKVLETGVPCQGAEAVVERPDGSRFTAMVNINPLFDANGAVAGAVNCFLDVTALRRAEADAEASRTVLEDFFENAVVPMHVVNRNGIIVRANKAELALLGYEPGEYIGRHIATFHASAETIGDILACLGRGDRLDKFPARLRAKDGSIKEVLVSSNAEFRDGQFLYTRCVSVDVTEQRAEAEARRNLAAIVESADDAIFSQRLDGTISSWNKAAERIYGYSAEEILGSHISRLVPEERRAEEAELIGKVCRGERVEHWETRRRRDDGKVFEVSLTVSPLRDSEGTIVGVSKIARDITQRKRGEERVRLLAREVDHRANNLLATILAILRLTRAESLDDFREDVTARITALAGAHRLLAQQVDGRTDFKRLVALEFAPYGAAGESRIRLDGPDFDVTARTGQGLALVLHELTTNAAKYGALSKPEGTVEMSWIRTDGPTGRGVTLRWVERGGPPAHPPSRKGFGTNLIQAVVENDLQGTIAFDWRAEGLVCALTFQSAEG